MGNFAQLPVSEASAHGQLGLIAQHILAEARGTRELFPLQSGMKEKEEGVSHGL